MALIEEPTIMEGYAVPLEVSASAIVEVPDVGRVIIVEMNGGGYSMLYSTLCDVIAHLLHTKEDYEKGETHGKGQSAEGVKHIARYIRVRIFINRQAGGGVLHIKHHNPLALAGVLQFFLHLFGKLDELFARIRADLNCVHAAHCRGFVKQTVSLRCVV